MGNVRIKRNDTKGEFTDTLKLDGEAIDLSGCTVSFLIKKTGTAIKRDAVIVQTAPPPHPSAGKVKYSFLDLVAQSPPKGKYRQEWEVVFPDTEIHTFPDADYNGVEILEDLG